MLSFCVDYQQRILERGTSRLLEPASPGSPLEYREDPEDEIYSDTQGEIVGTGKEVEIVPAHFEFSLIPTIALWVSLDGDEVVRMVPRFDSACNSTFFVVVVVAVVVFVVVVVVVVVAVVIFWWLQFLFEFPWPKLRSAFHAYSSTAISYPES